VYLSFILKAECAVGVPLSKDLLSPTFRDLSVNVPKLQCQNPEQ